MLFELAVQPKRSSQAGQSVNRRDAPQLAEPSRPSRGRSTVSETHGETHMKHPVAL